MQIPKEYDFGTIPIGSSTFANIMIENITSMPAKFTWEFLEEEFTIEHIIEVSINAYLKTKGNHFYNNYIWWF